MQVIGNRLYAGSNIDLQAYDITDPDQPAQVWTVLWDCMPEGFSVNGTQVDVFGWGAAGNLPPWSHSAHSNLDGLRGPWF